MDSEGDSEVSSPTWSIDDGHSEMTTSTDEMFAVEGDSGCSPDIGDDSLTCERIAAIQDEDIAVMVQVSYTIEGTNILKMFQNYENQLHFIF